VVSAECLRLGLADEVRYSILPVLIARGSRSSAAVIGAWPSALDRGQDLDDETW
jgi:hypothetical protein